MNTFLKIPRSGLFAMPIRLSVLLLVAVAITLGPIDVQAKGNKADKKTEKKDDNGGDKGEKKGGRKKSGKKGGGGDDGNGGVRSDVLAWLKANNQGLENNFLENDPCDRMIKLPDGQTIPIYKTKQFLDANFRLTFYARKNEKGSDVVPESEMRLRKLLATPLFHDEVKSFRSQYRIAGRGDVSSGEAYSFIRHINRNLGVTAGKQYHAPVGGGGGIAAPSWAVWKAMNLFWHEACHCIGIGHDSGGLSGPIAGKMKEWDHQKKWDYQTVDLNALTVPQG
jgi:hypothetical protein